MKCANCPADAIYTVADPAASTVHYCAACLPKHLREQASAGQLALAPYNFGTPKNAKPVKKAAKTAPVEEEATTTDTVVAEEVTEEDA